VDGRRYYDEIHYIVIETQCDRRSLRAGELDYAPQSRSERYTAEGEAPARAKLIVSRLGLLVAGMQSEDGVLESGWQAVQDRVESIRVDGAFFGASGVDRHHRAGLSASREDPRGEAGSGKAKQLLARPDPTVQDEIGCAIESSSARQGDRASSPRSASLPR